MGEYEADRELLQGLIAARSEFHLAMLDEQNDEKFVRFREARNAAHELIASHEERARAAPPLALIGVGSGGGR